MKKLSVLLAVVVMSAFSVTAFAAGKTADALTSNTKPAGGYRQAGCGLGSVAIKDEGGIQILAATLNGTSGNQTFGITSGTSNCTGMGGYVMNDAQQEMYVSANAEAITQEAAQGSGEHLAALSSLMGCDDAAHFSAAVKKNFRAISAEKASTGRMIDAIRASGCSV